MLTEPISCKPLSPRCLGFELGGANGSALCLALADDDDCLDHLSLSATDEQRLEKLARPARQREFTRSRRLLYTAAALHTQTRPTAWRLTNPPGAPPVLAPQKPGLPVLHASLSHGGQWTAAAVSVALPVGIDVETDQRRIDRTGIAAFLDWPHSAANQFLPHWTLWEAGAKSLRQSVFTRMNPAFKALCGQLGGEHPLQVSAGGYHLLQLLPDKSHCLSLVIHTG